MCSKGENEMCQGYDTKLECLNIFLSISKLSINILYF